METAGKFFRQCWPKSRFESSKGGIQMNRIFGLDAQTAKRSFQLIGLLTAFACSSFGSTITFTDITTANGTIGSTSFTSAPITISGFGDTSSIQPIDHAGYFIDDSSASIAIGGVGTFEFATGTRFFVNNTADSVGFARSGVDGADLIDGPNNSGFSSWFMLTSIGPITGGGVIVQWNNIQCPTCLPLTPVVTTGGTLVLDNAFPDVAFSARVGPTVPEPGTFLLLAIGLLSVGCLVRHKTASE
jgi:hypothetical protein